MFNRCMRGVMPIVIVVMFASAWAAGAEGEVMRLHPIPWKIDGKPPLGTYGAERLEDLERVREIGMNLVLGGHRELDPSTPEGAFCLEHGIKVLPHVTSHVYHGVTLREPIDAEQTTIPLHYARSKHDTASNIVQLDDEHIRYEAMTDEGLVGCERGYGGTVAAAHREGMILFWPEECRAEIESMKDAPSLYGYYVLDDSPGDARSALRAMYSVIKEVDPEKPVCAGFGDTGSMANFGPGVCDIMMIYWYPVSSRQYHREQTATMVQHMLAEARERVPGISFMGIYQAFDGRPSKTGQGVPTPEQLREQLEDFAREGASGLVAFAGHYTKLPGWVDLAPLGEVVEDAIAEIAEHGGTRVRPETESMARDRIQPPGFWEHPEPLVGRVPAWYVLGPFEVDEAAGWDAALPPDEVIDLNAVYPVRHGTAGWRVRETTSGFLGLSHIFGGDPSVAYTYCEIECDAPREVQMRIGSDDDAWVRVNGKGVYRFDGSRGLEADTEIVPVALPAGRSTVLVKCANRGGIWGVFMRFTDADGKPAEGLVFSPEGN